MPGQLQYLERSAIDDALWDRCIDNASNGRIYAYTFYLDTMAGDWHALVLGEYEAVMPLPFRKKYGVRYVYQPPFCAQLGIFGKNLSAELVAQFLHAIPKQFRLIELSLNQHNRFTVPGFAMQDRVNYVVELDRAYEQIFKGYRENIRRNIKKCEKMGCHTDTMFPVEEVITLAKLQPQQDTTAEEGYRRFTTLYNLLSKKQQAITYGIRSQKGELLSSAAFIFSHQRAYYILVGNHPNGRTLGASHALIDVFIRNHCERKLLLDFEGSDLRNLAFFYSSFGANEEYYPALKLNRLPWWMRWAKS
jgi:hypothetical protein